MTTRKVSAILSLLGLGLSLSLLHSNSQAASKANRALSRAEMASTQGASLCASTQCNNEGGCTNFNAAWIAWYPVYVCDSTPYGSCSNSASAVCWRKWWYSNFKCPDSAYLTGSITTSSINYCGLWP